MFRILLASVMAIVVLGAEAAPKQAPRKSPARAVKRAPAGSATKKPAPPVETPFRRTPYVGALAADAATGRILFSDRAGAVARPASVTKLMTALLVLEDVAAGKYTLETPVTARALALQQEASIIGFRHPETKQPVARTVDTLLYALMIRSANDAAVALAEHANGTMAAFVARMNARAAELGMTKTVYYNPNGLPPNRARRYPWKEYNTTTCEDQLKLALVIMREHPEITKYTSCKTWVMPDGTKIVNHNTVMRMDKYKIVNPDGTEAIDGLKTGYIDAGGSSVVLTGTRNGQRVLVVVLGSATSKDRDTSARAIMVKALEKVAAAATTPAIEVPTAPSTNVVSETAASTTSAAAERLPAETAEPAAPAEDVPPPPPATASGGFSGAAFAWGLLVGAVVMAGAVWGASRWLRADNRDRWDFGHLDDPPSGTPS